MKNIVSTLLTLLLLTMGSSTLVSAQNSNINSSAPVTQQDLQSVKSQQKVLGRQLRTVNGKIDGVKSDVKSIKDGQAKLAGAIADHQSEQDDAIQTTRSTEKSLEKSIAGTKATTSALWSTVAIVTITVLLLTLATGFGVWYLLKKIRKHAEIEASHHRETVEELKQRLAKVESAPKGIVYLGVIGLRKTCQELLEKDPNGDHRVPFTYDLPKNPQKGFGEGGEVSGYIAVFDTSKPLENQFPRVYYNGEEKTLRLEDLPKHAAGILGLKKPSSPEPTSKPKSIPMPLNEGLITGPDFSTQKFLQSGAVN